MSQRGSCFNSFSLSLARTPCIFLHTLRSRAPARGMPFDHIAAAAIGAGRPAIADPISLYLYNFRAYSTVTHNTYKYTLQASNGWAIDTTAHGCEKSNAYKFSLGNRQRGQTTQKLLSIFRIRCRRRRLLLLVFAVALCSQH